MPNKRKKPWFFGAKDSNISTGKSTPTPTSPSPKYFRSIAELPLNRYVDCLVNDNLAALIISGFPDPLELAKAWADIQMEYHDAIGDAEYRNYAEQLRQISIKKVTYSQINMCITQLAEIVQQDARNEEVTELKSWFAAELNLLLNTNFVFDLDNPEAYINNLSRCINRSKGVKIDLELKLAAFEAVEKKYKDGGEKATADYFQSVLITLSDAAGFHLKDDITVLEYCKRVRRIKAKT